MKKIIFMLAMLFTATVMTAQTQDNGGKKAKKERPTPEQMQEAKINHIVNTLALDDATAAKFRDVYKDYDNEMKAILKGNGGERKKPSQMSDAEIEAQMKARFQQSRKILDTREKYYDKFRKILNPRQVKKVYDMEHKQGAKIKGKFNQRAGKKFNFKGKDKKGLKQEKND